MLKAGREPQDPRLIRVGMPVSLSGPYRKQGAQALRGISLWVEEVNRKGGLYVREQGGYLPLELRYYDDQSKRQKAAHIVRELIISDRVDLLMGPYSSALTVEAAAVASCPVEPRRRFRRHLFSKLSVGSWRPDPRKQIHGRSVGPATGRASRCSPGGHHQLP